MRKKYNFLIMTFLIVVLAGSCFLYFKATGSYRVSLNHEDLPYVLQDGKVYLYLKDILRNGFVLDKVSGENREDKETYRYVLWTEDILEDTDDELSADDNIKIEMLPKGKKGEIYINGLQIGCYSLGQNPLISLEEFAEVSDNTFDFMNNASKNVTIFFDKEGDQILLEEKVVQISPNFHSTLDGQTEAVGSFGFENCSPYLVQNDTEEVRHTVSLQTLQPGEILRTEKGEFLLKKIYAGEIRGMRIVDLMDGYINFSMVLEGLGLSAEMNNGVLFIEGQAEKKTILMDKPEALGSLHYYKGRVFQIGLKDRGGSDLDCLYTGDTLYININDTKTKKLLREKGFAYRDYRWEPIG